MSLKIIIMHGLVLNIRKFIRINRKFVTNYVSVLSLDDRITRINKAGISTDDGSTIIIIE